MWKIKWIGILIGFSMWGKNLFIASDHFGFPNAGKSHKTVHKNTFSPQLLESSGLGTIHDSLFYTHTDSQGEAAIYFFDLTGNIYDTLYFKGIKNIDWESAATDLNQNIYLGDVGNNLGKRTDLKIYKIGVDGSIDSIQIKYKNQATSGINTALNDSEAMFWHENYLYLFSKNRKGFQYVYKIPDIPGRYTLNPLDSIYLPHMITGADLDKISGKFVLLGYGALYTFQFSDSNFFSKPDQMLKFSRTGQAEAILFLNEKEFLITNEKGKIYHIINH